MLQIDPLAGGPEPQRPIRVLPVGTGEAVRRMIRISGPTNEPLAATGCPRLDFHFAHAPSVGTEEPVPGAPTLRAGFIGQLSRALPWRFEAGPVDSVIVELNPPAAAALTARIPLASLMDRRISLVDVMGTEALSLFAALAAMPARQRSEHLHGWLSRRLPVGQETRMSRAVDLIARQGGSSTIRHLAGELALSPRQFERRFRQEMGISPKRYSRIVRCQRAVRLIGVRPDLNFAAIADLCRYADQAHMVRDFQQILGMSPTQARRRRIEANGAIPLSSS